MQHNGIGLCSALNVLKKSPQNQEAGRNEKLFGYSADPSVIGDGRRGTWVKVSHQHCLHTQITVNNILI